MIQISQNEYEMALQTIYENYLNTKATIETLTNMGFKNPMYRSSIAFYNQTIANLEKTKNIIEVTVKRYYFDQGFDYVSFEEIKTIEEHREEFAKAKSIIEPENVRK